MGHGTDDELNLPSTPPPSAEVQRRLLRAVTELVGADGREGLTAEGVAARAGVGTRTFLEFFADVDTALIAAHDDLVDTALHKFDRPLAHAFKTSPGDAALDRHLSRMRAVLLWLLDEIYGCLADRPAVARVCLVEAPTVGARGLLARERAIGHIGRTLERHTSPEGVHVPNAMAIQMVAGGIYDTAQQYAHSRQTAELPAVAPAVAEVWSVVLANR